MIGRIRRWFLMQKIKEVAVPAKKSVRQTLNPALKIAILFDGTSEEDRKTIHKFKKQLSTGGRQIVSLAFINNKLPLDNVDYQAYNLRDVNWFGMPSGEKTNAFIQSEFDVILAFIRNMQPHFEYIFATSHSRMIIGPAVKGAEHYFHHITDTRTDTGLEVIISDIIKCVSKVT
jgi:hypothetical protein